MSGPTDEQLLTEARSGNRVALEQLLERHEAQVFRFGMKMCGDPEDAKDVLQDTLLTVARSVRDFRGASSLSTWLYSIAHSFCVKKRRKSKFAPREEHSLETEVTREAEALADASPDPAEALASKQVEQALERALDALEPKYREVLILRDVEGLAASEVAEVLGISVQAVKSRLHRARLSVRATVAPLLGIPDELSAARPGCPDVLTLFSQHLEDEISGEICAAMEKHLASCPHCRGACDSLKRTLALCRTSSPPAALPSPVQTSVKLALRDFLEKNG